MTQKRNWTATYSKVSLMKLWDSRKQFYRIASRWDRYILGRKMDRTTYWDYSLSWYNLAGEKVKWWDQIIKRWKKERKRERQRDRKKERKKEGRKAKHFTSFKVHSADNQALLWGHHPGTDSESGSPFSSINPIIQPSRHTLTPKHRRRQDASVQ